MSTIYYYYKYNNAFKNSPRDSETMYSLHFPTCGAGKAVPVLFLSLMIRNDLLARILCWKFIDPNGPNREGTGPGARAQPCRARAHWPPLLPPDLGERHNLSYSMPLNAMDLV